MECRQSPRMDSSLNSSSRPSTTWTLYPVALCASLVVVLVGLFLLSPVVVTLDGYSHLYGAETLRWMWSGQPEAHRYFSYNSLLLPNWLSSVLLAGLSVVVPGELALKLLAVLTCAALLSSLYYCVDVTLYQRHQRAQVLIVLLPVALNVFMSLGFYGFLLSISLCLFVLGLLLRHGLEMPLRLQCVVAGLLLAAYYAHPIPVVLSFLFPAAYVLGDAVEQWRKGPRNFVRSYWPWLPPACIFPWFYLRLSQVEERHPGAAALSFAATLIKRISGLARDSMASVSPTTSVESLYIALLSIVLAGAILSSGTVLARNRLRFYTLGALLLANFGLSLIVPDRIGDGSEIVIRFLLLSVIFLFLLALSSGTFNARRLTVCSLLATLAVVAFSREYLLVSRSMASAVAEVRSAMESIPAHSRILMMGYQKTSSCQGSPMLDLAVPERHWALVGALKNELIVLNDYEANTSHFPLQQMTSRYPDLVDEIEQDKLSWGEWKKAAWLNVLNNDDGVDFVVSWGISRAPSCDTPVAAPLEDALKSGFDLVYSKEGSSRVQLWRKRG